MCENVKDLLDNNVDYDVYILMSTTKTLSCDSR